MLADECADLRGMGLYHDVAAATYFEAIPKKHSGKHQVTVAVDMDEVHL